MNARPEVAFVAGPLAVTGPNVAALDLAAALAAKGGKVAVLAGEGPFLARFAERGLPVTPFDLAGRFPSDLPRLPEVRRAVLASGAKLIHVTDPAMASFGILLSRVTRRPLVLGVADPKAVPAVERGRRIRALVAPSAAARDELVLAHGWSRDRVHVVPPAVDLGRYPRPGRPFAGAAPVLGAFTRLDRDAGLDDLLEAVRLLLAGGLSVHLIIAGAGPEEERTRRAARDAGIQKHVTVTEPPRGFERILDSVDIVVHPRRAEWTGHEVLQAMAAARPVVAAGAGAVFTLLREGETGLIAPARSPVELASRIAKLLRDPERAVAMGRAARDAAGESFSVARAADRLFDVYERVIEGG